jgi:spore coat protein U-like protein
MRFISIGHRPQGAVVETSRRLLALLLVAACATAVSAATVTTTFTVSATVLNSCSVSATDLAFGSYDPIATSDNDATSTVSVTCTLLTPYHVQLNEGLNSVGGAVTARRMKGPGAADYLTYALYRDALRTLNWGKTDDTDTVNGVGAGILLPVEHTVYGRVTMNQDVNTGAYSDTITVTISY